MPPAPLAHEWQHCLDHRDCSEDVDVELTPHLFERTLLKSPFVAVSCTVVEDVYRTNISFGPCNLGTDGCEIRDIQYDGSRVYGVHRDRTPVALLRFAPCQSRNNRTRALH